MEIVFQDANKLSDDEMVEMMKGYDMFVFATGVDERVEFPAPVYDYYYKYNIAPLERYLPLAKKAGMKGAVVCGSYFTWLAKERPDMKLTEKHPYIKSRLDQEKVCEKYSSPDFQVGVLELPYIFGTQPGRKPVWVILIERLQRFEKMPCTLYSKGGTAMLTVRQVGEAMVGAKRAGLRCRKQRRRQIPCIRYFLLQLYLEQIPQDRLSRYGWYSGQKNHRRSEVDLPALRSPYA